MKTSAVAKNKEQYEGFKAAGIDDVRMMGAKRSDDELERMAFEELREEMLYDFIPCGGCRTKEELLVIYHRDVHLDKTRLPLYNKRGAPGQLANFSLGVGTEEERSDGRCGLVPCMNRPACFNAEDGHTAFTPCGACGGPMYCSDACRVAHLPVHGKECEKQKMMHEAQKRSQASMRAFFSKFEEAMSGGM